MQQLACKFEAELTFDFGTGIKSSMPDVASLKWRGLELITKSYAKSASCATSASLRCIIRVSKSNCRVEEERGDFVPCLRLVFLAPLIEPDGASRVRLDMGL